MALLPGHTGAAVGALIGEEGIALLGVPCGGEVRSTAVILEPGGRSTVLNEHGPEVRPTEWSAFEAAVAGALRGHRVLVCSGSLPPGAPPDALARLTAIAREHGATAIVDASGPALSAALAGAPDLVTPNLAEAEAALGLGTGDEPVDVPPDARPRAEAAALALCDGGARAAVVTAAAAGAAPRRPARRRGSARPRSGPATRSAPGTPCSPASRRRSSAGRRWAMRSARGWPRRAPASRTSGRPARPGPRRGVAGADGVTLLLGLDVGTTSCKAGVFSPAGDELGHGRAATPWRRVATGAEADPHALLAAAVEAAGRRSTPRRTAPSPRSGWRAWARRACCSTATARRSGR